MYDYGMNWTRKKSLIQSLTMERITPFQHHSLKQTKQVLLKLNTAATVDYLRFPVLVMDSPSYHNPSAFRLIPAGSGTASSLQL